MKRFEIAASSNTPHIVFDADTNQFLIEGKSFPEDSKEFYRPILEWLENYKGSHPRTVKFCFNLFYLSSSSVISIKQFLKKAVEMVNSGTDVVVEWAYDEDDE